MIVASIDIGTNTVLLLIAEVDLNTNKIIPLINEYRMPRIGRGVKKTGFISSESLDSLYSVLDEYDNIIKTHHCEQIIVTGTNALRIAANTPFIIKEIKKKFGYKLNVITGKEEAEYAYFGATFGDKTLSSSMVIDIGGSSTEIISGIGSDIISKLSLQLGSVSGTEQFLKHSPPLKSEIEDLNSEIQKQISNINLIVIPKQVIAIAGTATTIACMNSGLKEFDENQVNGSTLTLKELSNLVQGLNIYTNQDILDQYGSVMNGREDIILAGAYMLFQFMDFFNFQNVTISTRGIRYGAIVNCFHNAW